MLLLYCRSQNIFSERVILMKKLKTKRSSVKKLATFLLAFVVLSVLIFVPVSASAVQSEFDEIKPCYEITCSSGGKHNMCANGMTQPLYSGCGDFNQGSVLLSTGFIYQCKYCNLMCVSQREPSNTNGLGYYAMLSHYDYHPGAWFYSPIYACGASLYYESERVTSSQNSYWQGFNWTNRP